MIYDEKGLRQGLDRVALSSARLDIRITAHGNHSSHNNGFPKFGELGAGTTEGRPAFYAIEKGNTCTVMMSEQTMLLHNFATHDCILYKTLA